ncbi:MAG: hypothetical protein KDE01_27975, partial [Caldilineaceae bacterium]|nr:hypothetical protein [Caldilineaceae bacterium]
MVAESAGKAQTGTLPGKCQRNGFDPLPVNGRRTAGLRSAYELAQSLDAAILWTSIITSPP